MANEVKITVRAKDETRGFAPTRKGLADVGAAAKKTGRDVDGLGKETQSVGRKMANSVAGMVSNFGNIGASIVSSGGPVAAIGVLGAALATLPVLATVAGAGIGIGLGAGIAGVGIAVAAQNEKVKASFSGLKDHVLGSLKGLATPFESVLIGLAGKAKSTFDRLAPSIGRAFARVAPMVQQLGGAVLDAFGGMGPTIERAAAAFGPLVNVLSARLPGLISNVANQLVRMAEAVDPRTFNQIITGLNDLVSATGTTIVALEKLGAAFYSTMVRGTDFQESVRQGQKGVWKQIADALGLTGESANQTAGSFKNLGDSAQTAADQTKAWHNAVLASYNSQLAFREAVEASKDGIERQKGSIRGWNDLSTKNYRLLLNQGTAALRMAEDAKKSGGDVSGAMNRGYNAFIKAARGAGATREEAKALARAIGVIPGGKNIKFRTNSGAVRGQIREIQHYINSLRGRTIANRVVTYYSSVGSASFGPGNRKLGNAHGGIIGAQGGGPRSRQTLVGEQGPEIVDLAPGSMVRSNPDTRRILQQGGGMGGGQPYVINIQLDGKTLASLLFDPLKGEVRKRGGKGPNSAQKALGWS